MKQFKSTLARLGRKAGSPGVKRSLTRYGKMLIWAGDPEMKKRIGQRLMQHVIVEDGCWRWKGSMSPFGYGRFNVLGQVWHAHRIAWILRFGPIKDNQQILHRCDNPQCTNPDHLFAGTDLDNQRDAVSKGRHLNGERCPQTILTESDVKAIRGDYKRRIVGRYQLGIRFGVSSSCIQAVITRRTWKHVA